MTLEFLLTRQSIRRLDTNKVYSKSRNYLKARFSFETSEWQKPIHAIFSRKYLREPYQVLLDENNECIVPWEVLEEEGYLDVSVYCGNRVTSQACKVLIYDSGYTNGIESRAPSPDVYSQLLELIRELQEKIARLEAGQSTEKPTVSIDGMSINEDGELVVSADGHIEMYINDDGDLIVESEGGLKLNLYIDEDGNLVIGE